EGSWVSVVPGRRVADRAARALAEADALAGAIEWPGPAALRSLQDATAGRVVLELSELSEGIDLGLEPWGTAQGNAPELAGRLAERADQGYRVLVTAEARGSLDRAREVLADRGRRTAEGAQKAKLAVPSDQFGVVARYMGGEEPRLHRLGTNDWPRAQARVRRAVREMAGELVRLYSVRMAVTGHAFPPDTPWQRELEDAFPYEETRDQLSAIEEVKRDMEQTKPMDRLICGDVGYGKTEIAIRAAFKAVMDGKH